MPVRTVNEWASEWSDGFDQGITVEQLVGYVGKRIRAETDLFDGPKGFEANIVGFSVDTLVIPAEEEGEDERRAYRYSVLTEEGLQLTILAGMVIEEVKQE